MLNYPQINIMSVAAAALEYAQSGIPVFPCKDKRPLTAHGFKDASFDSEKVQAWWQQYPEANIGSPTGAHSFVLDIDLPDGPASLEALTAANGPLPETLEQTTGSGGKHLFFKIPAGIELHNSASKIGNGIDIRAQGGYVILPPSLHESGNRYQWGQYVQTQEAPAWLIETITGHSLSSNKPLTVDLTNAPATAIEHLAAITAAKEGQRNDALNRACFAIGQLIARGDFTKKNVIGHLYAAAKAVELPAGESFRTIQNGIEAGKKNPLKDTPDLAASKELNIFPWPVADPAMFSGFAGEFVEFATENSEADPIAVLVTFLSRFGIETGRGPCIVAGNRQHARINAVLVGQSSKARKGTSCVPIEALFNISEDEWKLAQFSPGPLSSGEGIIYAIRDERREYVVDKQKNSGKFIVTDPGIEDKRLHVIDEEFAGALSCSKRDGNTLSSIIRGSYDGHKVEPLIKTSKIGASSPHVAIVTHITKRELLNKMDMVEAFNGFANRFLWVCVRRQKLVPFPQPLDEDRLQNFRQRLVQILRTNTDRGDIPLNSEAKKLWGEVYPLLTQEKPGLAGAISSRAETNTIRLALIYALLDTATEVEKTHLQSALALWDYCEQSVQFIFGEVDAGSTERRILEAMREKGQLDTRGLYDIFSRNISKRHLEDALASLIASARIVVETQKSGNRGRPKKIFSLCEKNELNEKKADPANG